MKNKRKEGLPNVSKYLNSELLKEWQGRLKFLHPIGFVLFPGSIAAEFRFYNKDKCTNNWVARWFDVLRNGKIGFLSHIWSRVTKSSSERCFCSVSVLLLASLALNDLNCIGRVVVKITIYFDWSIRISAFDGVCINLQIWHLWPPRRQQPVASLSGLQTFKLMRLCCKLYTHW